MGDDTRRLHASNGNDERDAHPALVGGGERDARSATDKWAGPAAFRQV